MRNADPGRPAIFLAPGSVFLLAFIHTLLIGLQPDKVKLADWPASPAARRGFLLFIEQGNKHCFDDKTKQPQTERQK